jgi:hypothetical protein
MPKIPLFLAMAGVSLLALLALPAGAAIVSGQVDDFEDGGVQNWEAGSQNPHGPTNILSGGPDGVGDNYLRLVSDGSGSGGTLVVFNERHQWAGNYLGAGVSSIQMQVKNFGMTDLLLRLILDSASFGPGLTSSRPISVPAASDWRTVSFSLASSDLAGGAYNAVMSNVLALNLVHSPSVIGARSSAPNVLAHLGVNNITAVPEPSTLVLAGMGLLALMYRGRRKSRDAA